MAFGCGDWTQLILDAVDSIADEAYQRRAWFGSSGNISPSGYQEVSSPDEEICRLYDDLDFGDYLDSPDVQLNAEQRKLGDLLKEKLDDFIDQTPQFLDPWEVIDDPRWHTVRNVAGEFARALRGTRLPTLGDHGANLAGETG